MLDKISDFFSSFKFPENQKPLFKFAILLTLLGLVFIFLGRLQPSPQHSVSPEKPSGAAFSAEDWIEKREEKMARELEDLLGKVKGVGKVRVFLTLDTGPEKDFLVLESWEQDVLEETDAGGGERSQEIIRNERQVAIVSGGGGEEALVIREIQPMVRGVVIVAQGAENDRIKAQLSRAASRVLDVPLHRVKVLPQ